MSEHSNKNFVGCNKQTALKTRRSKFHSMPNIQKKLKENNTFTVLAHAKIQFKF